MNTDCQHRIENGRMNGRGGRIASLSFWGLLALGLLGFTILVFKFWPYTMDDSYITFRYARNLAAGHGLVFNPGEQPRAEGITSPLYAILLSLAPTSIELPTVSKWVGALSVILTALFIGLLIFKLCRSLTTLHRPTLLVISATGICYYLLNPYIVGNAMSGMETSLAGLAFALFLFLLLHISSNEKTRYLWPFITGTAATIVPMLRPEMGLVVIVCILALWLIAPDRRRHIFVTLSVFIGLGTLYFCARYLYYQMILPLPFYIKQGGFGLYGISEVEGYMLHARILVWGAFGCLAFACARESGTNRLANAFLIACVVAIASQLGYYSTIRHIMGFGLRYFQPLVPGIVVIGFVGVCRLYGMLNASRYQNLISLPVVFTGLFGLLLLSSIGAYWNTKHVLVDWYARGYGERGITNWQSIADASKDMSIHIAMNDCGKFPYYTEFATVDLAGLNNRAIARGRSSEATILELKRVEPSLVILCGTGRSAADPLFGWEGISSDDIFSLGYNFVGSIKVGKMIDRRDYYWLVFTKSNKDTDQFLSRLAESGVFEYILMNDD